MASILLLCSITTALAQDDCRPRPISGTGTGNSFAVFLNGSQVSQHSTPRGAVRKMEGLIRADSLAQVVIMEYLWGIWQTEDGDDCAPRSPRPPWPISLTAELPTFEPDSVAYFPKEVRRIPLGENHTRWADSVVAGKVWRHADWPDTLYVFQRENGTWPGASISEASWKDGKLYWAAKLGAAPFEWDEKIVAPDSSRVTYRAHGDYLIEVQPAYYGTSTCRVPNGEIIKARWTDEFSHEPPDDSMFERVLRANPSYLELCEVAP